MLTTSEKSLTAERLRELLAYDLETGVFTWRVRKAQHIKAGSVAGYTTRGYVAIMIDGYSFRAHRLAWLYVNGVFPTAEIDHVNGMKADNRIVNLRSVGRSENLQNQARARSDNRSGYLGVKSHQGNFQARITIDGKSRHIGTFATPEEAHAAYVNAKRQLHPFGTL